MVEPNTSIRMGRQSCYRKPTGENLIGWNILARYMWPYILTTYLLSNLIAGTTSHPSEKKVEKTVQDKKKVYGRNFATLGIQILHSNPRKNYC